MASPHFTFRLNEKSTFHKKMYFFHNLALLNDYKVLILDILGFKNDGFLTKMSIRNDDNYYLDILISWYSLSMLS